MSLGGSEGICLGVGAGGGGGHTGFCGRQAGQGRLAVSNRTNAPAQHPSSPLRRMWQLALSAACTTTLPAPLPLLLQDLSRPLSEAMQGYVGNSLEEEGGKLMLAFSGRKRTASGQ